MAGTGNHGSPIDEWLPPPTPSPRTLMSSFLNEEFSTERRAARAGFSVPKLDTSRVGSSAVTRSPVSIPSGLSPTTLPESPVFLYNKMAQPFPTTGTLPYLN
ncbi:unnamed protein product [Urochloa humidicola]